MKAIKIFCILVLALTFFGCATQKQLTREESLKLRNEQIETTTKIYNNVSKEQVLIAVDRLFRLCDSDDFKIAHMENAVTGERRWLIYLVLAAAAGQDQWIVAAEEDAVNKKVKVVVRVTQTASTFIPMATTGGSNTWTVATLPGVESTVPGKALYFIFFKRLDYLLGKTDNWLDCDTASKIIEEQKMEGSIECLCNPFNIIDAKPVAEDFGTLMVSSPPADN